VKGPVCGGVTATSCDPGTLGTGTLYHWWVVAADEHGAVTTGPVWGFTTEDGPGAVALPVPAPALRED
jgi:hypothetical protein